MPADVFQALTAHLRAEKAAQAAQLGTKARLNGVFVFVERGFMRKS
jgi:hypothetical protein